MQTAQDVVEQMNIMDDTLFQKKADDDNHVKRMRYNTSCVTANITTPGSKFENVPDVIGIFISKFDIFKAGKTIYHIDRVIRETKEVQENGLQEIYVNTKIDDGTDISELMRIFSKSDAYDFEKFPKTSARKKQFKENEGGREDMCDIVEEYARQRAEEAAEKAAEKAAKEAARTSAQKFFKNGATYEMVRASIDLLSEEELQEIYRKVKEGF